jgi:hypothetical protein
VSETSRSISDRSDTLTNIKTYERGLEVKQYVVEKSGAKKEWENKFDDRRALTESRMLFNGEYVVRFVVTRNGSAIVCTTAYGPKGEKRFFYPGKDIRYINSDGSPRDGGEFE